MTNEEFWKKLDNISRKPSSENQRIEFMETLRSGYDQDLNVIVATMHQKNGLAFQSYLGEVNARFYICYTSIEHAKNEKRLGADGSLPEWNIIKLRDMMNNMFNKTSGAGLVFNPDSEADMVIILKPVMELMMPGAKAKPPMFKDA